MTSHIRTINYLSAIAEAQREEMARDSRVFLMGEDIRSGLFATSRDLVKEFGPERVRDTPISEQAFVGAAIGAAMTGLRPIVDFTIASFVYVAMDQLVSQAAKSRYMFGGQVTIPVVFRAAMMYGGSLAAQHSDRPYAMFMNVPGFKVIVPATAYDAKGLLKSAVRDDNVVMYFEDSTLWFTKSDIPRGEYLVPIGQADVKVLGTDVTIVSVAGGLPHALAAAGELASGGLSAEVVDVRTLVPLDIETILRSVAKTGRVVIVDPAHRTCSAASEISAVIVEEAFESLKAPIVRVTTPNTHIPFSSALEKSILPNRDRIIRAVHTVCDGAAAE